MSVNVCVCVCVYTCTMGSMLRSGELLVSSSDAGATKLKPLKSWWALALGGIPGESAHTHTHTHTCIDATYSSSIQELLYH